MSEIHSLLRQIPKVDEVLAFPEVARLMGEHPRELVLDAVRKTLSDIRQQMMSGNMKAVEEKKWLEQAGMVQQVVFHLRFMATPMLRRVINATGVILHTNLGRAVLSPAAIDAVNMAASGYSNLELLLESGKRGSRYAPMEDLLTRLTGAQSSLVVNNNAAAVLLALGTLAKGQEVIVSRGQLVEIGGSFRIPEVMEQSGVILREVGATNKTHPDDYRSAINEKTALLLYVHTSNYKIVGFTRETSVEELVGIGREAGIPVMSDLGSGSLLELEQFGLPAEPTVQQNVRAGADVVTFSGDKLLGGPQAGIILGSKKWLDQMKKNPLTRAVRIDKMAVAALEATLREYLDHPGVIANIPTLRMISWSDGELETKAQILYQRLKEKIGKRAEFALAKGTSAVGGGAMPTAELPSWLVVVRPVDVSVEDLAERLRKGNPAVLGMLRDNGLWLDVRTLLQGEELLLADAVTAALDGV